MSTKKLLNRDLSHLKFNLRVADEAFKKHHTLGSRTQFIGISFSNLAEFMKVRYPTVCDYENEDTTDRIADAVIDQYKVLVKQFQTFNKDHKIIRKIDGLNKSDQKWCEKYFKANIFPALLPITVDLARESDIHEGMYVMVVSEHDDEESVGYVEVPTCLDRFIQVQEKGFVVAIEDMIQTYIKSIIHGRKITMIAPFSILRSAEVYVQPSSYMDPYQLIKETLSEREKSWITQLEVAGSKDCIKMLKKILQLEPNTISFTSEIIRLSDLKTIPSSIYKDSDKPQKLKPVTTFPQSDIFSYIKQKDRLVFHPYESYDDSVVRFLEEAASDPSVVSIRITLYRVSEHSRIIDALLKAADKGKLVTVLVELKARFDEKHNMQVATIMREGGVRIVYTKPDIKTHAKLCLVCRNEKKGLRVYSHVATGNYSEANARIYTDYSYFTADQTVGNELTRFFNLLTSDQSNFKSRKVVYAPYNLKSTIIDEINHQMKLAKNKKTARITVKCNALTDEGVASKLVDAAKSGVEVTLIVRSACIIQPQKNIHIYSIVGQQLEHSRIYVFGSGKDSHVYIGSADLMTRNLSRRNELLLLIEPKELKSRIMKHIGWYLQDTVNRRRILEDYKYEDIKPKKGKGFNCHTEFRKEARSLAVN